MRYLSLSILLCAATAFADKSTVTVTYKTPVDHPKTEASAKGAVEKRRDALEKAAAGKAYSIQFVVKIEAKDKKTKCSVVANIGTSVSSFFANLNSSASVDGPPETSATDCVEAVVEGMLDKQIVAAIEKKSKG